jgi:hypothetical protein
LLAERVRVGELSPERLRLAAFVGHPDARDADPTAPALEAEGFLSESLRAFAEPAVLRMAIAAGWAAVVGAPTAADLVAAMERAFLCPCGAHLEDVRLAPRSTHDAWDGMLRHAVGVQVEGGPSIAAALIALDQIAARVGSRQVLDAIRVDVAPWALGERDPVRERVDSRRY